MIRCHLFSALWASLKIMERVVSLDPQLRVFVARSLMVAKADSIITGYTHEEALGKNPRILKSGYHSSDFYEPYFVKSSATSLAVLIML